MSWRDSKGRWHGVPEYLGGETRPTPAERKRFRPTKRKRFRPTRRKRRQGPSMAARLAEVSRRQMASSKKSG